MKHRWAALAVVLALCALGGPRAASAQAGSESDEQQRRGKATLGQNFPNPFNPETKIPFELGDPPSCTEQGRTYRVTLRIYNVLAQVVAVPMLQGDGAPAHLAGQPIENLSLPCGRFTAYWDGKYVNSSREVASGVYLYRLEVDGVALVRKMLVSK